jgi:hypothetical protein
MPLAKIILLTINIIGGIAVVGSYIWGAKIGHGGINALWGGTPEGIRPVYTVSMAIAALGYLTFIFYILFKLDPNSFNFNILYLIFFLILGASAFWLPLTNIFLVNPGTLLWLLIRIVLAVVGIASCVLVWVLMSLVVKESDLFYWLAAIGSFYFAFHTAVLDMILWPIFFKMQ